MGVTSYEVEIGSPISPTRLFKALVLEADTLIPEIMPQAIKSIEVIEGNGGPGTIRKLTFAEGLPYTYSKNRTESLDAENFTFKYTMIEGDVLPEKLEKITNEIQIVSGSDGAGSVFTSKTYFHTVGEAVITEEELNKGKEEGVGMFKAIEAYLLKNPDVCD